MQHVTKATLPGLLSAITTTLDTDCLDLVNLCGVKRTERNVRNVVDSHINRPWGTEFRFLIIDVDLESQSFLLPLARMSIFLQAFLRYTHLHP